MSRVYSHLKAEFFADIYVHTCEEKNHNKRTLVGILRSAGAVSNDVSDLGDLSNQNSLKHLHLRLLYVYPESKSFIQALSNVNRLQIRRNFLNVVSSFFLAEQIKLPCEMCFLCGEIVRPGTRHIGDQCRHFINISDNRSLTNEQSEMVIRLRSARYPHMSLQQIAESFSFLYPLLKLTSSTFGSSRISLYSISRVSSIFFEQSWYRNNTLNTEFMTKDYIETKTVRTGLQYKCFTQNCSFFNRSKVKVVDHTINEHFTQVESGQCVQLLFSIM